MSGQWGATKRSKNIHYYPNGRKSLCGIAGFPAWVRDDWDTDHDLTCPSCKHMLEMLRLGFKPVTVAELYK